MRQSNRASHRNSLTDRFGGVFRNRRAGVQTRRRTLSIEPLEERTLLSLCTWTGGSLNSNLWSDAGNWSAAPVAGDQLKFSGTQRTATYNDLAAGTPFESIEFNGSNFSLAGNALTLTNGITVDAGVSSAAISLDAAVGGTVTVVDATAALTISGNLFGSNGLTKAGAGTLALAGDNSYTGGTTISAGTVRLQNTTALTSTGSGVLVNGTNAVLDLNGYSITVGAVSLIDGSIVNSGPVAATLMGSSYLVMNGAISVNLSGSGGLTKGGSGAVALSGANDYTGLTTVAGGTLELHLAAYDTVLNGGGMDVRDGRILFDYTGTSPAATILADLTYSYHTGSASHWDRGRFLSSTATTTTGLGWVDNGTSAVTVVRALYGDATLDGCVDLSDLNIYGQHYRGTGKVWAQADFNYDGTVTISDLGSIGQNWKLVFPPVPPEVTSITRLGANPAGTGSVQYLVTFSQNVTGVDAGDFAFATGSLTGTKGVNGSGAVYTVTVSGVTGNGTLDLDLIDNDSITATASALPLGGEGAGNGNFIDGQTYTINNLFADPDLAAAVREALGMAPDAVLTTGDVARLTSLSADSNLIGSLQGLQYATSLTSLSLVPGDFSKRPASPLDLAPLADLPSSLTTLVLQDCGLVSPAFPTLSHLESLDLRYNSIVTLPSVTSLSALSQLMVYGNPLSTTDNYHGLQSIKGKLINIDLAPDRPERAQTIADLANACYYLPIEMYEYVLNTIEYQPYPGSMKGALATLQTKAGNDWDTATLLKELYSQADISSLNYASAMIVEDTDDVLKWLGVKNAKGAYDVLYTAGLAPALWDAGSQWLDPDMEWSQTEYVSFYHTWLHRAEGGGLPTLYLDPSWKFRDFQPGVSGIAGSVPFNETGYFSLDPNDPDHPENKVTAYEFYEDAYPRHVCRCLYPMEADETDVE
jgi:autotransporter-associated beta strand protein